MRAPVCQLYLSIMRKGQWERGSLSLLSDYWGFSQFTRSVHSGEWPLPGHVPKPLPRADAATLRQSNQFSHGSHPHLLHHPGAMDFYRLLDGTEVAGDLFVQFASYDIFEHFPLARCERGQACLDFGKFGLLPPKGAVFLKRRMNRCKQVFIIHRLGKEITSAVFHCLDALGNIARTGQKNNGQETACLGEDVLEFETIQGRHSDIEHETAHYLRIKLG